MLRLLLTAPQICLRSEAQNDNKLAKYMQMSEQAAAIQVA